MKVSQFSAHSVFFAVIFLLLIPVSAQAVTRVVTEGQSIADALAISTYGDSVKVAVGEYRQSGLEMPTGVYLGALSDDPLDYPRLIGDSGETIIHCEDVDGATKIAKLIFEGDFSIMDGIATRGHGIHTVNSTVTISHCSFLGLKASYGGAIFVGKGVAPLIRSCHFDFNEALATGGAISAVGSRDLTLDHCLFEGNTATAGGSVLNVALGASALVTHCTMVGNGEAMQGDIQAWASGSVEVTNCIMADSQGRPCYGDYASTPDYHCSDLTGSAGGDWIGALAGQAEIQGNISLPPMFCGDQSDVSPYTLDEDSPCTGDANPGCGIMGAFEIGCDGSAGTEGSEFVQADEDALPTATRLRGNYPNPFNPLTTIAFDLKQSGQAAVDVYDLAGRLVRNLHSGVLAAGTHEVMWNGRGPDGRMSAAGIYFFRLKTETVIDTQRMTLVK